MKGCHAASRFHDFCAGHRVHGHESKCRHLHGHNYRIHFHCVQTGTQGVDEIGRVVDFSVINEKLCQWLEANWDHRFLVWDHDPLAAYLLELDAASVVRVPFNPTAENMAEYLVNVVAPRELAGLGIVLASCIVEETRKCSASYTLPRPHLHVVEKDAP